MSLTVGCAFVCPNADVVLWFPPNTDCPAGLFSDPNSDMVAVRRRLSTWWSTCCRRQEVGLSGQTAPQLVNLECRAALYRDPVVVSSFLETTRALRLYNCNDRGAFIYSARIQGQGDNGIDNEIELVASLQASKTQTRYKRKPGTQLSSPAAPPAARASASPWILR